VVLGVPIRAIRGLVFLFFNFKIAVKPFGLSLLGLIITGFGLLTAGIVLPR